MLLCFFRYRDNRHVSMGAEKWLDIEIWNSPAECFSALKKRGYRIATTYLGTDSVFFFTLQHFGDLVSFSLLYIVIYRFPWKSTIHYSARISDAMCHWMHGHMFFSVKNCSCFVQTVKIVCPVIYRDKMRLLKKIFAVKLYCLCVWSSRIPRVLSYVCHKWMVEVKLMTYVSVFHHSSGFNFSD